MDQSTLGRWSKVKGLVMASSLACSNPTLANGGIIKNMEPVNTIQLHSTPKVNSRTISWMARPL